MTDPERAEALLDIVDPDRTPDPERTQALVVLGLAERDRREGPRPTTAGWTVLGPRSKPFRGY